MAVPQDFRWGRALRGLFDATRNWSPPASARWCADCRGRRRATNILARGKVIASTKHFLADGGTVERRGPGRCARSTRPSCATSTALPYGPAIERRRGHASWPASRAGKAIKMTGNHSLLTGVLKERMGFGGFIVSDWNAAWPGRRAAPTKSCPQALLAGIDMYMAPDTWKPIYDEPALRGAKAGAYPDGPAGRSRDGHPAGSRCGSGCSKPASRPRAAVVGRLGPARLARAPRRSLGRQCAKSLVLLKNQGCCRSRPGGRLLVAGDGADDIARARPGGWTVELAGHRRSTNSHFPGATSLSERPARCGHSCGRQRPSLFGGRQLQPETRCRGGGVRREALRRVSGRPRLAPARSRADRACSRRCASSRSRAIPVVSGNDHRSAALCEPARSTPPTRSS